MESNLNCQKYNCAYNKNSCCYAFHIKIEGYEATITPETYCDSFKNKSSFSFSNFSNDTNLTTTQNISCSAKNCTYNMHGACNASHVNINFENATCETFRLSH